MKQMPASKAQIRMFIARRAAAKKAEASKSITPAPIAEVVERKPRAPVTLTMTIQSAEERTGEKVGAFGYFKVRYVTKGGIEKTGATAMAFGDAYAAMKDYLFPGATLKTLANFNVKKGIGYSLSLVGLPA